MDTKTLIKKIKDLLNENFESFEGIYFFGSRMKDPNKTDSDFDFVFVFSEEINSDLENKILDLIYPIELEYNVIIDYKVYSHKDILRPKTPFRSNVKNEGKFYSV